MLADTADTGISVVDWEYGVMVMVCEEFSLKKYAGHLDNSYTSINISIHNIQLESNDMC